VYRHAYSLFGDGSSSQGTVNQCFFGWEKKNKTEEFSNGGGGWDHGWLASSCRGKGTGITELKDMSGPHES